MRSVLLMAVDMVPGPTPEPGKMAWIQIDPDTGEALGDPVVLLLHRAKGTRASWQGMRQTPSAPAAAVRWLMEDYRASRCPYVVAEATSQMNLALLAERAVLGPQAQVPMRTLMQAMPAALKIDAALLDVVMHSVRHELPPERPDAVSMLRRMLAVWRVAAEARWHVPEIQAARAWAGGPR